MELLSDFDPADQVSQLLRVIRIRSTVYCRSLMAAPWGFGVEAHGHPAFHVVTRAVAGSRSTASPARSSLPLETWPCCRSAAVTGYGMSQPPRHVSWTTSSPRPRRISTAACATGAAGPAPG